VRIVIDLTECRVLLTDPDDFTRFSVAVEGEGDLAGVVRHSGLGRLKDDEHVAVDPVALRALVGTGATDRWDEDLAGMLSYAAGKGWMEADGGVLAHIEHRDEVD
jgi:hypothetical protein